MLFRRSGPASSETKAHAGAPFKEATETDGFYNRPPGDGRFPVRSVDAYRTPYPVNAQAVYPVRDRYALFSYSQSRHNTNGRTSPHSRVIIFFTSAPTPRMTAHWILSCSASAFPPRNAAHAKILP